MTFVSYAQNFEDVLLWRALQEVKGGTYLDIGAQDPITDSVSFAFYQAGWRGTHVEAAPSYADRLRKARPDEMVIEAAVTDAPGPIEFYEIENTGLSTGKAEVARRQANAGYPARKIMVPCVRLDRTLDMLPAVPHWLKIDVEGMEAEVLRSWGSNDRRPWILVVESTAPSTQIPTEQSWIREVVKRGYRQVLFDGLSRYFVHESKSVLGERMTAPANVFDGFFITSRHFAAGLLLGSAQEQVEAEIASAAKKETASRAEREALTAASAIAHDEIAQLRVSLESQVSTCNQAIAQRDQAQASETIAIGRIDALQDELTTTLETLRREMRDAELALRREAREAEETVRRASSDREQNLLLKLSQADTIAKTRQAEILHLQERFSYQQQILQKSETSLKNASEQLVQREQALGTELRQAEAIVSTREAEISRLHERSSHQQEMLQQSGDSLRLVTEKLALSHSMISGADAIFAKLVDEPESHWILGGITIGLSKPRQSTRAVVEWLSLKRDLVAPAGIVNAPRIEPRNKVMIEQSSGSHNPYLRADGLSELLSWGDVDFVRCAYVTILGRQPESGGENYYVRRLRMGFSKYSILRQLRRSDEGLKHDPGIAGLDRALKRDYLCRLPLVGVVFRILSGQSQARLMNTQMNMLENKVDLIASKIETICSDTGHVRSVANSVERIERSLLANLSSVTGAQRNDGESTVVTPALGAAGDQLSPRSGAILNQIKSRQKDLL